MVELCELRMLPDEDQWPDDIDTRIAALNFGGDSVLFESFDPSVSTDSLDSQQLRERCQPRKDDFQLAFADSGHWQSGVASGAAVAGSGDPLTTWGRIRTSEPFDERTASAPDVANGRPTSGSLRPNSLIANFVANTTTSCSSTRFVDVNDNEIVGLSPTESSAIKIDRWRRNCSQRAAATASTPRRTFADLSEKMAPELEFLALHHEMPSLCESTSAFTFNDIVVNPKKEALPAITSLQDLQFPNFLQDDSPDSGLGCSGPTHIEDWPSLSVLLPKHVAEACSFFKSNTQLLTSSSSNCIDRCRRTEPCRTCYRVRRRIHPPLWAQTTASKVMLCDCAAPTTSHSQQNTPTTSHGRHSLRPKELSIIGLPVYASKRALVEEVVEGVAALSRGEGYHSILCAMRNVIEDGLKADVSVWTMIKTVTSKGPATKHVHSLVKDLDECAHSERYRVDLFFEELIRENSLDCWLCYVVLKENVLRKMYNEQAFLAAASCEYRTLLWRMVDSLSLLPVLEARESRPLQMKSMQWGGASRIASDSRVPKSSSVPARLSNQLSAIRQSRIPLPTRPMTRRASVSLAKSQVAWVTEDVTASDNFELKRGEKVRVLARRHGMAHCNRLRGVHAQVSTGIVPIAKLCIPNF